MYNGYGKKTLFSFKKALEKYEKYKRDTRKQKKKVTFTLSDKCSVEFWIVVLSMLANTLGI